MSPVVTSLAVVGLIVAMGLSALISALETALFCLKKHHVKVLEEKNPQQKELLRNVSAHLPENIQRVLLLSTLASLSLAVIALFMVRESLIVFQGHPLLTGLTLFAVIIVFGDFIPKMIALARPDLVFRLTLKPLALVSPMIARVSAGVGNFAGRIAGMFFPERSFPITPFSDKEYETLVRMQEDEGALKSSESEIIQDIIRLGNKTVKDCMTPRVRAFLLSDALESSAALALVRGQDKWRWKVPVYHESIDVITGILDLRSWLQSPESDFRDHVDAPVFIPETMKALDAFHQHLNMPRQMAIVVDEYGGMEGTLTHSELIEEILEEAAPSSAAPEEISPIKANRIIASGDARLDDLSEDLGVDLEREGLDTIGGLVFTELGRIPEQWETVEIDHLIITVRKMDKQQVSEVSIDIQVEPSEEERPAK